MSKTNELEELQETLKQIFFKNLNYFKTNNITLYNKIMNFEKLNIENFAIDFNDNRFELINTKTKQSYYKKDPFIDASNRVSNFDLMNAFALIKLEKYEKRNHYENEINSYEFINEYIKEFSKVTDIKINKFVFIGTLLGVHINDFHNTIKCQSYLIIEESIEIFRLSMFMTDYTILEETSKVFFAIAEDDSSFNKIIKDFLSYKKEFNNLIHFELADDINKHLVNKLSTIFTQSSEMRYPFSEYIISLKRGFKYFEKSENKILNLSNNHTFLNDKKVIFLGAGVSLAKNIEYLYLNRNNFIIVASSAVLKHLEILDIKPDIILLIDGQKDCMLNQFKVKKTLYKNSIILASIKIDEELFSLIENKNCFYIQNSLELFQNNGFLTGITIGDIGIDILLKLGVKELYLLGIDAAIDSKNGKTHIGTHQSSRKIDLKSRKNNETINFKENIVYVKGNFQKEVPTFLEYIDMIESVNLILQNTDIKVFNLSNGAYFNNTNALKIEDLNIKEYEEIDKERFYKEVHHNLQKISKNNLSQLDKKNIQKERKVLAKLSVIKKEKFFQGFKSIKRNFEHSIIINILDKYFTLINPYYYFSNTSEESDKIMQIQIERILNEFNSIYDTIES